MAVVHAVFILEDEDSLMALLEPMAALMAIVPELHGLDVSLDPITAEDIEKLQNQIEENKRAAASKFFEEGNDGILHA